MSNRFSRRDFLKSSALAGVTGFAAAHGLSPQRVQAQGDQEIVYLSIVTQVPFWIDHQKALEDAGSQLGIRTTFTGPVDFDVAGQALQLDEIVVRQPAGIIIFPGDADTMTPGINRAIEAGIPIATVISDVPNSNRLMHIGIDGFNAGRVGGEMLAEQIGGEGKVILGFFPSPNVISRVDGYKSIFAEKYPGIEVVEEVDDRADPAYAPTAYAQALQAHPDAVAIGGTDGDSGKGAAQAVRELGLEDQVTIVAMDRNEDMLDEIETGVIYGAVVQKSYTEMYTAVNMLYWLANDLLKVVPDPVAAGLNILPENIETGVFTVTADNVAQFRQ